ncbi:MAG: putative nucleic acid-binding protein, contains PIN domain protein [uncultured archaeon A07HN63]|jgi:Predicted nucleic acid-binding protein, contains PIN domain|nr:MAG: putative nucleic acid-binding protein, contains PIN domain protein [uncultured archaeon A07HN63]
MILDTTFIISLFKQNADAFAKGNELVDSGTVQRLPSPVLYELEYGAEIGGDGAEKRAIGNLAQLYPIIEITERLARKAGRLCAAADSEAGGVDQAGIDNIDPLIAAVADDYDEPVLTRNATDFEKLGVAVVTY